MTGHSFIENPVLSTETPSESPSPAPTPHNELPKPLQWPDWHGIVDLAAAVLVVITAFLIGSFTATNSDLWPHLAWGRLWSEGKATFGVDPFSYMTEGRYWTNHAWLWDIIAFTLYTKDATGGTLVQFKACQFAGAVILLLLIRQRGRSLWPWVVGGALAAIASASFAQVRPFAANPLFLMATMHVLFRLEWKPGSYRNALILAGLFALWSNMDNGFVFGPILVGLTLLGELIQKKLPGEKTASGPPIRDLAIAFAASTAACMVNPHHMHVWQWPAEFAVGLPAVDMLLDNEMVNVVISPLSEDFFNIPQRGYNLNGLALLLLFIGVIASLAVTFRTVRVSHLLIAIVFGYFGIRVMALILPASFVLAVIMAMNFNRWSQGIVLKSWGHPASRLIFLGSGIGRIITLAIACLLVPAAWPGWLHPSGSNRRVSWAIEADEGLVGAARMISGWRSGGVEPASVRHFHTSFEFANYVAWFAPGERVFLNQRWNLHAPEVVPFLELRRQFLPPRLIGDSEAKNAQMQEWEKIYSPAKIEKQLSAMNADTACIIGSRSVPPLYRMNALVSVKNWTTRWYGGNGLIVTTNGDRPAYNPTRELFEGDQKALPSVVTLMPTPPSESWADDFLRTPKSPSAAINDAKAALDYGQLLNARLASVPVALFGGLVSNGPRPLVDSELAIPLLAIRAARRAVADNPDDYRPYAMLLQAYSSRQVPELWPDDPQAGLIGERRMQTITLARRILARLPRPDRCNIDQAMLGYSLCEQLIQMLGGSNQRDAAFAMVADYKAYFKAGPGVNFQINGMSQARNDQDRKAVGDQYKKILEDFDNQENQIEQPVLHAKGLLKRENATGPARYIRLIEYGLVNEAIAEFENVPDGEKSLAMAFQTATLMLNSGLLERAEPLTAQIRNTIDDPNKLGKINPQELEFIKQQLPELEFRVKVLEGNVRQASDLLEKYYAKRFPPIPSEFKKLVETFSPASAQASWALGSYVGIMHSGRVQMTQQSLQDHLSQESRFAFQAAVLAILDGRIADARQRLDQCLNPKGDYRMFFPWTTLAERYRQMIGPAKSKD